MGITEPRPLQTWHCPNTCGWVMAARSLSGKSEVVAELDQSRDLPAAASTRPTYLHSTRDEPLLSIHFRIHGHAKAMWSLPPAGPGGVASTLQSRCEIRRQFIHCGPRRHPTVGVSKTPNLKQPVNLVSCRPSAQRRLGENRLIKGHRIINFHLSEAHRLRELLSSFTLNLANCFGPAGFHSCVTNCSTLQWLRLR